MKVINYKANVSSRETRHWHVSSEALAYLADRMDLAQSTNGKVSNKFQKVHEDYNNNNNRNDDDDNNNTNNITLYPRGCYVHVN